MTHLDIERLIYIVPHLYRKEDIEVEINGEKQKCMAYVMNSGEISPPSKQYFECILQGYRENGLDTDYLVKALEQSIYSQQQNDQEECEELTEEFDEPEEDLQMTME